MSYSMPINFFSQLKALRKNGSCLCFTNISYLLQRYCFLDNRNNVRALLEVQLNKLEQQYVHLLVYLRNKLKLNARLPIFWTELYQNLN